MSIGKLIVVPILIFSIGLVILSLLGYFSLAPFVILLGTFIAGLATKEVQYGALVGFLAAISVILISGIIFIWLFILGLLAFATLILFLPFLEWSGSVLELGLTTLFLSLFLSPIIGAIGGFLGGIFFEDVQKSSSTTPRILSGFEGLTQIPPPVEGALICLSCGTANDPRAQFCKKCGAYLEI